MALILTEEAELLSQQTNVSLNIVLEIDGFSTHLFGAVDVRKDLVFDMDGVVFDGTYDFDGGIIHENSKPYISLAGTTNNITQQMSIDKGVESIKSFTVSLVDINDELTELFMPGNIQTDILGRRAKVFVNFVGSEHPNDSVQIMEGIVGTAVFKPGVCNLTIDHSSQLKRQDLLPKAATLTDGSLSAGTITSIDCDDTTDFLIPTDVLTTYVRIEDEIFQYTGKTSTSFTGVTRESLGTSKVTHDDDSEILSIYRLQGNAIDLSLKLMLSGGGYGLSTTAENFVQITGDTSLANAIHFNTEVDVEGDYGLVVGDNVQITGSSSNNVTGTISSFGKTDFGSYIVITGATLTTETESSATVSFKSKYDTLGSVGCGMLPTQVDVPNHQYWYDLFSTSFPDYDFQLDDTIEFNEFLQQELYRPMGLYSVPGTRANLSMTIPPLSDIYMKTLDSSNVKNPDRIAIKRSISKYFYSSMVYKYDPQALDQDKYMAGLIVLDADSSARINYGSSTQANKPFKVESKGLRNTGAVNTLLGIQAKRFLDRYKYAAEHLDIEVLFSVGFQIEVGDVVAVEGLSITDTTKGSRDFGPRLFECTNKSLSLTNGNVKLSLLSTAYGTDGRWGVISPSSVIDSGATTTTLPLTKSYGWTQEEKDKWESHIGQNVLVHDDTWTFAEEVTLNSFSSGTSTMVVSALSAPPSAGYIVDIPNYDVTTTPVENQELYKTLYCFSQPSLSIASVSDASTFTVTEAHAAYLKADSVIEVHDATYTNVGEAVISSITSDGGTEIVTLKSALSFTPSSSYGIQLISWLDGGKPYRIL